MGAILDMAGYVAGVEAQKGSAIFAILFLVSIAPSAFMLLGVFIASLFRIGRSEAIRLRGAS